jgi:hypothetical protein
MLMYPLETVRCETKCLTFLVRARRQSSRAYREPCIDNKKPDAYKGVRDGQDIELLASFVFGESIMSGRMALETLGLLAGLAIAAPPPFLNGQDVQKLLQKQDVQNQVVQNVVQNKVVRHEDVTQQPVPALPSRPLGPQLILWSQSERPQRIPLPLPHSSMPPRHPIDTANPNPTAPQTYRKY